MTVPKVYSFEAYHRLLNGTHPELSNLRDRESKCSIEIYLKKFKRKYKAHLSSGELEKTITGEQREFEFFGSCNSSFSMLHETPSRQDVIHHFKSARQ